MSLLMATQVTAIATAALALFAIVTAILAGLAFRKQSAEVAILGRQLDDQAKLLKVQSEQLDLQSQQFEEQRKVNADQTGVFSLQSRELEASLAERKEVAARELRAQANRVTAWFAFGNDAMPFVTGEAIPRWGAVIRNDSDLPIVNTRVFFHFVAADSPASLNWNAIMRGGPVERIRVIPPHSGSSCRSPNRSGT
jgi:hypothetical protein